MLNFRWLQDEKIELASAKHSKIDIESEVKVLNLRWLQNRKIFVTSERRSAPPTLFKGTISLTPVFQTAGEVLFQISSEGD